MNSKLVSKDQGGMIQLVVLDSGEEAFATLTRFANEQLQAGLLIFLVSIP